MILRSFLAKQSNYCLLMNNGTQIVKGLVWTVCVNNLLLFMTDAYGNFVEWNSMETLGFQGEFFLLPVFRSVFLRSGKWWMCGWVTQYFKDLFDFELFKKNFNWGADLRGKKQFLALRALKTWIVCRGDQKQLLWTLTKKVEFTLGLPFKTASKKDVFDLPFPLFSHLF